MGWTTWRGLLSGAALALLLTVSASATLAQTAPPTPSTTAPKSASTAAAPTKLATKTVAKKPQPAHPASKLAARPARPAVKKLAAAPKKPAVRRKIAATAPKKPAEPKKIAAAVSASAPPSYTVTTTRDNVTYTTTRIVPLPPTPPRVTQVAAVPVSLAPQATAVSPVPAEPAPAVNAVQPANSTPAAAFVAKFLDEAFRIARSDGTTSLQRRALLADLFARKMDVRWIAGYTTSDELTGVAPEIQQRFRTILISYLVETYYPRLELASDPSVTVETTPAAPMPDGTAVVWTTFSKAGWSPQSVKWRLLAENGGFQIVDIFSAGASLVQMERDTFLSVMRNGGLTELMAKLDERTKALATAATE